MPNSVYTTAELDAEITRIKAQNTRINTAIDQILEGAQTYSLDTGQTRQSVTRASLGQLEALRERNEMRLARLCRERHGGASTYAKAAW